MIHFFNALPMPPSVNACYENAGKRRIKSPKLLAFHAEMRAWALPIVRELRRINGIIVASTNKKLVFDFVFYFGPGKIYTKSGQIKQLDVSNRIKAIEDVLCGMIGIDDRLVFKVMAEKRESNMDRVSLEIRFLPEEHTLA